MWNVTKKQSLKRPDVPFTREGFKNCRKSATSVIERFERHYQWLKRDSVRMLKSLSPAVRSIRQTSLMDSGIGFHGTTYTNSQKIKVGIQYWFLTDPAYQQQINRFHFHHKTYLGLKFQELAEKNIDKWIYLRCRSHIWITQTLLSQNHRIEKETISSLSQANPVMPAKEHISN